MFRVGDRVEIKSYDEIEKTLNTSGILIDDSIVFTYDMKNYCGQVFEIIHVFETKSPRIRLKDNQRAWHPIWLVPQMIDNRSVRYEL